MLIGLHFYSASAQLAIQSAVLATVNPSVLCLSVRPSVRLSQAGNVSKRLVLLDLGGHFFGNIRDKVSNVSEEVPFDAPAQRNPRKYSHTIIFIHQCMVENK